MVAFKFPQLRRLLVMNVNLWNINMLGVGFMLVFSAFTVASFMESIVFKDYNKHGINIETGFHSLAIVYSVLGLSNWFAPAVVNKLGSKLSLFVSVIPNIGFIFCMYEPYQISVFLMSALLGLGGGILWTANGEVIARNSPGDTKAKNTGIFWSWFNMSALVGNTFLYFQLGNAETISDSTRHTIYLVLGSFSVAGMLSFLLLKPVQTVLEYDTILQEEQSLWQPIKDGLRFAISPQMGLLYGAFVFTGLSLNFWSSVYIVAIGNVFAKRHYLALAGICIGVGQVSSGFIWSVLTYVIGRKGVVLCATLICCLTFSLVFVSFPFDAATTTAARAQDTPIIASNIYLALFIALLIGLGDGGFNVSIYATLGTLFEDKPAPAFAVFKFIQGIIATTAFLYCGTLLLPYQLLILTITCLIGCVSFLVLDYLFNVPDTDDEPESSSINGPTTDENQPLMANA